MLTRTDADTTMYGGIYACWSCRADSNIPSTVLSKIMAWGQLPGSVAVMEAHLRADQHPQDRSDLIVSMAMIASFLGASSLPACNGSPALFGACISIVATLGKALSALPPPPSPALSHDNHRSMHSCVDSVQATLTKAMYGVTVAGSVEDTRPLAPPAVEQCSDSGTGGTASEPPIVSSDRIDAAMKGLRMLQGFTERSSSATSKVLQLSIALNRAQLQLSIWRRDLASRVGLPPSLNKELHVEKIHLSILSQQHFLQRGAESSSKIAECTTEECCLRFMEQCMMERKEDFWTQPGCHNATCSNLAGVSEAALPTLLCGGCRRVRYCGVECQRAAWGKGRHGSVCRKSFPSGCGGDGALIDESLA
ncbi:MAG: hypothetical protein WDW36_007520 [Sanguina aurantia]